MKKALIFTLSAALTLSLLAGCGSKSAETGAGKSTDTGAGKTSTGTLKDGKYFGTYDFIDGKGWRPQLEIEVKDGKIAKATFDYKNLEGKLKTQDANYNKAMKDKVKTSPEEYAPKFGKSLVDKQDIDKVDTVSGATHSMENFKALGKAILEKAAKGDTTQVTLAMNDTYTATEENFDERGYKASVSVTYKDGKIDKVVYDEVTKDNKKKSEDEKYNSDMKAKSGISAKEAAEKLSKTYKETGKVDTVSGATGTTARFKALVEKAVAMRK